MLIHYSIFGKQLFSEDIDIISNAEILQQAAEKYQEVLICSGYKEQLRNIPAHKTVAHAGAAGDNTDLKANNESGETPNKITNQETLDNENSELKKEDQLVQPSVFHECGH
ncbi:hypothetical protein PoB_005105000 [Plakobranchus ocellatus]|uniref:Uncharacterized protein n=1 Tax=Plakobranchus ocellatus TaxID=259542 RepID=A0AAV4BZ05_9GAST|nr:hypothetical protein PoB_005105000 [Plakobranchus ocellatus]